MGVPGVPVLVANHHVSRSEPRFQDEAGEGAWGVRPSTKLTADHLVVYLAWSPLASACQGELREPERTFSKRIPGTRNHEDGLGVSGRGGPGEFAMQKGFFCRRNDANQHTDPATTVSRLSVSMPSPTRCQVPSAAHGRCCWIFDLDSRSSQSESGWCCAVLSSMRETKGLSNGPSSSSIRGPDAHDPCSGSTASLVRSPYGPLFSRSDPHQTSPFHFWHKWLKGA
jgi:hypothetical protein